MEPEAERAAIRGTFDHIEQASGPRPNGWLSPGVRMT